MEEYKITVVHKVAGTNDKKTFKMVILNEITQKSWLSENIKTHDSANTVRHRLYGAYNGS